MMWEKGALWFCQREMGHRVVGTYDMVSYWCKFGAGLDGCSQGKDIGTISSRKIGKSDEIRVN